MSDGALTKDATFTHDNTAAPKSGRILPLFSLKGRTAIVSGAGAGIGLQVARGLAEAGANVAIWYNSNKKALDRAAEIEKEFGVKCERNHVFTTAQDMLKFLATRAHGHLRQGLSSQRRQRGISQDKRQRHCQRVRRPSRYLCSQLWCTMDSRTSH